jgi:hypothetical protein
MKRGFWAYFLVVISIGSACGKNVTAATPVSSNPPQLLRLTVAGNTSLTTIGQTSQLTVAATFSDGAVKDVSGDTSWVSSDASVMTVSPTGVVTVVRLGTTVISARYQNQAGTLSVTATPPGTFVIEGRVAEPGEGGVADLRVTDSGSSLSTQTGQDGRYYLAPLSRSQAHLRFEKDGYEPAELDAVAGLSANGSVQQIIRLVAGETVTARRLAPSDLTYVVGAGVRCNSCRLVRVVMRASGTLHVRLTWPDDCAVTLGMWIGAQHIVGLGSGSAGVDADVAAGAGEMIFYVDRVSPSTTVCHVPFVVATSLKQ